MGTHPSGPVGRENRGESRTPLPGGKIVVSSIDPRWHRVHPGGGEEEAILCGSRPREPHSFESVFLFDPVLLPIGAEVSGSSVLRGCPPSIHVGQGRMNPGFLPFRARPDRKPERDGSFDQPRSTSNVNGNLHVTPAIAPCCTRSEGRREPGGTGASVVSPWRETRYHA